MSAFECGQSKVPCGPQETAVWRRTGANPDAIVVDNVQRYLDGDFARYPHEVQQAIGHALCQAIEAKPDEVTIERALRLVEAS